MKPTKILLVEDSPTQALRARFNLEAQGFEVIQAANGRAALQIAAADLPDVILSDVLMPEMDGFQLSQALRGDPRLAGIPLILQSANFNDQEDHDLGLATGAAAFIAKGAPPAELTALIRKLLAEKAAEEGATSERKRSLANKDFEQAHAMSLQNRLLKEVEVLEKANAFTDTLLQTIPFPLDIVDAQGRVLYMNNIMKSYVSGEVIGRTCWELYRDDRTQCEACPLRVGIQPGQKAQVVNSNVLGGEVYEISHVGMIFEDRPAVMEVFINITQRKQAEEEVRQLNRDLEKRVQERTAELQLANLDLARAARMKDEFLASMSHELRTPLTGILGLSESLQMNTYGDLSERHLKTLGMIQESGRHLLELINDILDLSKIEAGRLDLQLEPCSLGSLCQASLQMTRSMAHKKKLQTSLTIYPSEIVLKADARRLKQLLVNLLSNAVKFTPEGGSLGIEVLGQPAAGQVQITVWDTGIGIAAEDLPRLFQVFVQLDSSLSRQYTGTGLGLALVKRLAELHNGSVDVLSEPGKGSRFIVRLPWTAAPEFFTYEPEPATSAAPAVFHPVSVLMADDDPIFLEMMSDFFNQKGCPNTAVETGSALLDCVEQVAPDILLVDVQMPGISGLEVMQLIRAHPNPRVAHLPLIAVTALAMSGDRERCLQAGATEYLSKPIRLDQLLELIATLCP